MVWVDGKPTLVKALVWPADDADLKLQGRNREGWSVMEDQILFWKAFPLSENPSTVIYMANTTSARDTQEDTITLERGAKLGYAAHRVTIVPDVGFVTAEWCNSGVYFRAHSGTGEFLRECHCPAQASYGELSVLRSTVSLCVTSNDPLPPEWAGVTSDIHFRRLDYEPGYSNHLPNDLKPETIATWNAETGDLHMVKIPQPPHHEIRHSAGFQYISPHKIVLASTLTDDSCGGVLCGFPVKAEDEEEPIYFYHGGALDPDGHLGCTSTSTPGPIVVHNHDSANRISIFKRELLSGDIPSHATPWDPSTIYGTTGMRETFDYPNAARILNFEVSEFLPSVAATRVLVNDKDHYEGLSIFVLDFDQALLASLVSKQPSERADWNDQLVDVNAQVKVVTRRFIYGDDQEEWDQEYISPQPTPPEWDAHLTIIFREEEDGDKPTSGVEYDEAPEEHRDPVPFGFVQTTLRLEGVDANSLAITRNAVLELPEPSTNTGRVFYFD